MNVPSLSGRGDHFAKLQSFHRVAKNESCILFLSCYNVHKYIFLDQKAILPCVENMRPFVVPHPPLARKETFPNKKTWKNRNVLSNPIPKKSGRKFFRGSLSLRNCPFGMSVDQIHLCFSIQFSFNQRRSVKMSVPLLTESKNTDCFPFPPNSNNTRHDCPFDMSVDQIQIRRVRFRAFELS